MKLFKQLIAALLASSTIVTTIAAAPITTIEDTFTHKNTDRIYVSSGGAEYMITADNGIVGRGTNVFGTDPTKVMARTEWTPIIKNSLGVRMDGVVGIAANNGLIYIVTSSGEAYTLGGKNFIPELLSESIDEFISDVSYAKANNSYHVLTTGENTGYLQNGTLTEHRIYANSGVIKVEHQWHMDTPESINKIEAYSYCSKSNTGGFGVMITGTVLLGESGGLYYTKMNGDDSAPALHTAMDPLGNVISDIQDFIRIDNEHLALQTSSGTTAIYNLKSNVVLPVEFAKDKTDVTNDVVALSILNEDTQDTTLTVSTNLGVFTGTTTNLVFNESLTKIDPILVTGKGVLTEKGKIFSIKRAGDFSSLTEESFQPWQYNNPILPKNMLAKFNIDANRLYERRDVREIDFSLITNKNPKGFNIYYAKVGTSTDSTKWTPIAVDVKIQDLNPQIYETGYMDAQGEQISGYTYTFLWDTTGKSIDLTHIQLIVEPIY